MFDVRMYELDLEVKIETVMVNRLLVAKTK